MGALILPRTSGQALLYVVQWRMHGSWVIIAKSLPTFPTPDEVREDVKRFYETVRSLIWEIVGIKLTPSSCPLIQFDDHEWRDLRRYQHNA
jgi:hypothetical protein